MARVAPLLGYRASASVGTCLIVIGVICHGWVGGEPLDRGGAVECWISPSLSCKAPAALPSLQELRFSSYLQADSHIEEEFQRAPECTCFNGSQGVSKVSLAMRPSDRTVSDAAKVLQTLADYINVSTVTALRLEGTGIYALPRNFFKDFERLSNLTITDTSNSEGFAVDVHPLMHSLTYLDLTNNSFAYASEEFIHALDPLTDSVAIHLAGNPFECDCLLKPLYDWLENGNGSKAVMDKGSLACGKSGKIAQPVLSCRREDFECKEVDVTNHLEVAYAIMSTSLAVVIIILLLVMWRKGSNYLSACLSSRRLNYTAVNV